MHSSSRSRRSETSRHTLWENDLRALHVTGFTVVALACAARMVDGARETVVGTALGCLSDTINRAVRTDRISARGLGRRYRVYLCTRDE